MFWAYERSGKFRRGVYFLGGRAESFVLGAGEGFLDWTVDKNVVPPKSAVFVSYRGVSLRVDPMSQDFGIFLTTPADGQAAVELFVDHAAGDKLLYLRVSRWERILRERLYPVSFRYTPPRPDWLTEALGASPAYGDEAMRTEERFLASLIRDFRLRNGLSSLAWDDAVAEAAKRHSADMETNGFFSHVSPTNGTLAERLARAGVSYSVAGENISRGFDDALEMHVAFLNSPAHRQNVVFPEYTHLGTGMAGTYMTVDFVGR
ncbi:MAG: Transporter [Brockia lithotrophica]|uniref:Transporter n=1 Tax=Brockia lithotrophica TaxID=933949 RepID=A0A2T5G6G9_9BACL|nr:MAG: Transporter [Brockia lithotrophica]